MNKQFILATLMLSNLWLIGCNDDQPDTTAQTTPSTIDFNTWKKYSASSMQSDETPFQLIKHDYQVNQNILTKKESIIFSTQNTPTQSQEKFLLNPNGVFSVTSNQSELIVSQNNGILQSTLLSTTQQPILNRTRQYKIINLSGQKINENFITFETQSHVSSAKYYSATVKEIPFLRKLNDSTATFPNGSFCASLIDTTNDSDSLTFEKTQLPQSYEEWIDSKKQHIVTDEPTPIAEGVWDNKRWAYVDYWYDGAIVEMDHKIYSATYQTKTTYSVSNEIKIFSIIKTLLENQLGIGLGIPEASKSAIKAYESEINLLQTGKCEIYNATASQAIDSLVNSIK